MTESDEDMEALAAIRMANKMLAEAGVGWGGLISGSRGPVTTAIEPEWVRPAPSMSIGEALEFVMTDGEGEEWLSLKRDWERKKYMAPAAQRRLFDEVYKLKKTEKVWEPE